MMLTNLIAPAAYACSLSLVAGAPSTPIVYNPFDPASARASVSIQIKNSGASPCDGAIAFFKSSAPLARGNGSAALAYDIKTPSSGFSLISQAASAPTQLSGASYLPATRLGPAEVRTLAYILTVAPGQPVPAGDYTDVIEAAAYAGSLSGLTRVGSSLPVSVKISAEAITSVNVAGGGQSTALDFGTLVAGATRSVSIQARSNQGYRLAVSSQYGGVMKLEPSSADGLAWQVPYTVRINNGGELSLRANRTFEISKSGTTLAGNSIPVEVKIGDPSAQRAGRYRDVIVVRIDTSP
jgi:hypothetical protein